MLNIYCLKWGTKYDHRYPNRLLGSLRKHCRIPFVFHCVTDDATNLHADIQIINFNKKPHQPSSVFTSEKLELMAKKSTGKNLLLDLDILIHDDITELVTRPARKPRFIWTHWTPEWQMKNIPQKTACFVNSSFVRWDRGAALDLWEHFTDNHEQMVATYNSLDKYLFYEHHLSHNNLDFWEEGIFYNYNQEGKYRYQFREDHKVCLFNTSHLIKMGRPYIELEQTPDWAADLWESYDEL